MTVMGDEALVGRLLDGRYRIGERIARGGMASVFLGTDERLDRTVAIKVMHRGLGDPVVFTERFKREAKAAAKLNHRNVVSVFDQGHDGDASFLIMEYVPGKTLRDLMREGRPMKPGKALEIIESVLVALAAAHAAHLIHRDIKPENVLITPEGEVKVADFGLARAVTASTTATSSTLIGTVSYLAPEIVSNTGADARSDVYAVGAMLYEMLTGVKPHAGDSPIQVAYKHVHEDIGPPSALQRGIPPYLDALVARATVRDRNRRAADARVMLQYLHLVRDALNAGLTEDAELTEHLTPPPVTSGDEPTVLTRKTEISATTEPADSGSSEPTVQWDFSKEPSEPVSARAGLGVPVDAKNALPQRRKLRLSRGQFLLIAAVTVAVLAAVLGYWLGVGRFVDAPMLVGKSEAQAARAAEAAGFEFKVVERKFSDELSSGTVMSTDPGPGGNILPGDTIEAVVSRGAERYKVPDLTGETVDEAKADLADLNLKLGTITERYSTAPKGEIIRLNGLKPGESVPKNTEIDVYVSRGREPVDLPDVVGKKSGDALKILRVAEFEVALAYDWSDDVKKGVVISQSPDGDTAGRGETVTITISKGKDEVVVPNVVGLPRYTAAGILQHVGLTSRFSNDNQDNWIVQDQTPDAGDVVTHGTTIVLGAAKH